MAIVTTFGAASAGTAISALTGAAATNAALAWLGGGTLVAGGAGVAGGEALLALAGPIGWAIGGAAVVGGGLFASGKNKEAAEKMYSKAAEVRASEKKQYVAKEAVKKMATITRTDNKDLKLRARTVGLYPEDFREMSQDQIRLLEAFINNVPELCICIKLIGQIISFT